MKIYLATWIGKKDKEVGKSLSILNAKKRLTSFYWAVKEKKTVFITYIKTGQ